MCNEQASCQIEVLCPFFGMHVSRRIYGQVPGNDMAVPRNQNAPGIAFCIPRNGSDVPKIVPGNAGTVPGNADPAAWRANRTKDVSRRGLAPRG